MDWGGIAKSIADQFVTVVHAPIPFIAAVLFAGWLIWKAVQREYATRLANAASTNEMLKEHLDRAEKAGALATVAAQAADDEPRAPPITGAANIVLGNVTVTAEGTVGDRKKVPENVTPASLMEPFRENNALKAARQAEPYYNQWMEVAGPVSGLAPTGMGGAMLAIDTVENRTIFCHFESAESVEALEINQQVSVTGRLEEVNPLGLRLRDCELLSV